MRILMNKICKYKNSMKSIPPKSFYHLSELKQTLSAHLLFSGDKKCWPGFKFREELLKFLKGSIYNSKIPTRSIWNFLDLEKHFVTLWLFLVVHQTISLVSVSTFLFALLNIHDDEHDLANIFTSFIRRSYHLWSCFGSPMIKIMN